MGGETLATCQLSICQEVNHIKQKSRSWCIVVVALVPRASRTWRLSPHWGPLGCQTTTTTMLNAMQEEPRWRLPTAVLDLAGGFIAATTVVSTPAGFLFACSLSVFICGLHLVCKSHTDVCRPVVLLNKHLSSPAGRPMSEKIFLSQRFKGRYAFRILSMEEVKWLLKNKHVLQLLPLQCLKACDEGNVQTKVLLLSLANLPAQ